MTFFNEANQDALTVAPDAAARGPRVGFLESWEVGWNEQVRGAAQYGIEDAMWRAEDENIRAMRRAGIENVPFLSEDSFGIANALPGPAGGSDTYLDVARFYQDGGDPAFSTKLEDYDKRIAELQEKYPELRLRTSREMWDGVRATAQEYESRALNDRRTLGGSVGAFLGGALASMNPNTDPLNFITLGVGGAGKTVAARVAGQVGAQGVIEGINQVTGVQEERRLLGLDYGVGDAVSRVAGTAIGAGVLQGVGEAAAFGFRRWFRSAPHDPAPLPGVTEKPTLPDTSIVPPQAIPADEGLAAAKLTRNPETYVDYLHEQSPLSHTRHGRARTVLDIDYVETRLNDWNGERPWELPPKTDTATTLPTSDFIAPDMHRVAERSQLDDMARQIDPPVFQQFDAWAQRKQAYATRIEEITGGESPEAMARVSAVEDRIDALMVKLEDATGKRAAKMRKDLQALEAERDAVVAATGDQTRPEVQRFRREMMKADEKMRDLAPLVSRAYARARNKWTNTAEDRKAVLSMIREGRTTMPEVADDAAARIVAGAQALSDQAPILRQAAKVEGKIAADADAIDVARAIVAENVKAMDEALETYRTELDTILGTEKNGEIEVGGVKFNLDKDTVYVPNENGDGGNQLTIRQLIEQNKNDEYEIEAVTTCSLRKTS